MLTYILLFPLWWISCQSGEVLILPLFIAYSGWGCLSLVTLPVDLIIAFILSRKTIKIFEEEKLTALSFTVICGFFSIAANWMCGIGFILAILGIICYFKGRNDCVDDEDVRACMAGFICSCISILMSVVSMAMPFIAKLYTGI